MTCLSGHDTYRHRHVASPGVIMGFGNQDVYDITSGLAGRDEE